MQRDGAKSQTPPPRHQSRLTTECPFSWATHSRCYADSNDKSTNTVITTLSPISFPNNSNKTLLAACVFVDRCRAAVVVTAAAVESNTTLRQLVVIRSLCVLVQPIGPAPPQLLSSVHSTHPVQDQQLRWELGASLLTVFRHAKKKTFRRPLETSETRARKLGPPCHQAAHHPSHRVTFSPCHHHTCHGPETGGSNLKRAHHPVLSCPVLLTRNSASEPVVLIDKPDSM